MADEAGFEIGRAFVSVDPDAADFDEKLAEQIGSPVVIVRVQADAADVDAQIDEQVGHHSATVTVDANTTPAREQVDELVSSGLPKDASFTVDADTSPAQGSLRDLGAVADDAGVQMEKLQEGANAASQAIGGIGGEARGAAGELSASSPEVQEFGERFGAVAQELRDFGEAAGTIAGDTAALDAALGRVAFALEGIHASGAVAVGELAALQGELSGVEAGLDTMEGAFGTAVGAMDDLTHGASTATGELNDLNGALTAGVPADMYSGVAQQLGMVAHDSETATQAQHDLRAGVDEASQAFTALAGEVGQLDRTVVGSFDDWGDFKGQVSGLARDLENLQLQPTAQGLEDVNMRLTAAGHAMDEFEQSIPGAVQDLGNLNQAASDGSIRTATHDYSNAGQEIADLGAAADTSGGKVGNLSDSAEHSRSVFQMFDHALTAVITSPWTWAVVGAAAIGALTYEMTQGQTELQGYTDALQKQYHAVGDNLSGYQHYAQALSTGGQAAGELETQTKQVTASVERFGTSAGHVVDNTHDLGEAQSAAATQVNDLSGHLSTLEQRYHLTQIQAYDLVDASKASKSALAESGSAADEAMKKIQAYGSANANAQGPVGQMDHDMNIFGNDALTASDRVGALNDAFGRLVGNFSNSQQAMLQVEQGFLTLASNAKQSGASMTGTNQASVTLQQSFYQQISTIQQVAQAMVTQGDSVQQVTTYIDDQTSKLSAYTQGSQQAQQAVEGLKTWEDDLHDSTGRASQALQQASQTLQNQFIVQLKNAGASSSTTKGDVDNLATAIKNTGTQSDATHDARAQLIKDLEQSGVKASTAKQDVDTFITSLGKIPKQVASHITVTGKGQWSVTESNIYPTPSGKAPPSPIGVIPPKAAAGMMVTGGTPGKDSVLISAMPGELVVPAGMVQGGAVDHLKGKIPGFAAGGVVQGAHVGGSFGGTAPGSGTWADTEDTATNQAVIASVEQAMGAAINSRIASAKAAASAAAHAGTPAHVSGSAGAVQSLAQKMAAARGWTGALWNDLNAVEMREAGWNLNAKNPGSDAYGIAQFINGPGEYAQYGGNANTAEGQITGFLNYVAQRYGTPAGALAHEIQYGWYDQGGMLPPGASLAVNNTGQPEMVLPPSVSQALTSSTGPIAELTQSIVNPGGPMAGLEKALTEQGMPIAYLQRTLSDPGGPMVQLGKAVTNPGGPMANLGKTIASPGGPMVDLKTTIANPGGPMVQLAKALNGFNPGGTEKGTGTGPVKLPGGKLGGGAHGSSVNPGGPDDPSSPHMTGVPVYNITVNYNGKKPSPEDHQAAMLQLSAAIGVA